jgi:hypothetical protein
LTLAKATVLRAIKSRHLEATKRVAADQSLTTFSSLVRFAPESGFRVAEQDVREMPLLDIALPSAMSPNKVA